MPKEHENSRGFDGSQERRRSVRYLIAGTVCFEWRASDGEWHKAIGVTRNIGNTGAFVECEARPPLQSPLRMVITLPTRSGTYGPVRLCGVGEVRHHQSEVAQTSGFGARAEFQLDLAISGGVSEAVV